MTRWAARLVLWLCVAACQPLAAPTDTNATRRQALLEAGHAQMALGDYETALAEYQRAAALTGLSADVQSAIGSANLRLGRLDQAETWLRAAVEADPDYAAAWNNLGVVLMEKQAYPEARLVFRRAFALVNGESEEIRQNLQLALVKSENPSYDDPEDNEYELVRRGSGSYVLLPTPGQRIE